MPNKYVFQPKSIQLRYPMRSIAANPPPRFRSVFLHLDFKLYIYIQVLACELIFMLIFIENLCLSVQYIFCVFCPRRENASLFILMLYKHLPRLEWLDKPARKCMTLNQLILFIQFARGKVPLRAKAGEVVFEGKCSCIRGIIGSLLSFYRKGCR